MADKDVFISYRDADASRDVAAQIQRELESRGYKVFFDKGGSLKGGEEWAKKLYDSIRASDLLIVLLEKETAVSDWVQREVDVARGAHVTILPLKIVESEALIEEAVKRLALSETQFMDFVSGNRNYDDLVERIESLSKATRNHQQVWVGELRQKWNVKPAPDNMNYAIYSLRGSNCKVHLATGNITAITGVDVIVNTENNYMQMARIFENHTVSSVLRYYGSWIDESGNIREDTVQKELDAQFEKTLSRPIGMTRVMATTAGHESSVLRNQNGARYILHVAAVRVDFHAAPAKMSPLTEDKDIRMCVSNCFDRIAKINKDGGISAEKKSGKQKTSAVPFEPIKSIVFPLFSTGQGGRSALEVIRPMADEIASCLTHSRALSMERVYVCVFPQPEVPLVEAELDKRFTRES